MKKIVLLVIILCFVLNQFVYAGELLWQYSAVNFDKVVQSQCTKRANVVVVGVIDTGIDYEHPYLQGRLWDGGAECPNHGWDFTGPDNDPKSQDMHGTYVAGLVAQFAPNARIAALRAAGEDYASYNMVATAIKFAIKHDIKVLNISLGFNRNSKNSNDDLPKAFDAYEAFGGIIICSAGNLGEDIDKTPNYPACYSNENTIVVGSIKKDENARIPSFDSKHSNYGENSVDVLAPGADIKSIIPNGKFAIGTGTSAAAPIVAGLVALVWGIDPSLSAAEVKNLILETVALDNSALLNKCASGGYVDFYRAVLQARGPMQEERICYKGCLLVRRYANCFEQTDALDLPSENLEGRHTYEFEGENSLVMAKKLVDYWAAKEYKFSACAECSNSK